MSNADEEELETIIRACHAASAKMSSKRSFRLRTLLQMVGNELEKERAARGSAASNGHKEQPNGKH